MSNRLGARFGPRLAKQKSVFLLKPEPIERTGGNRKYAEYLAESVEKNKKLVKKYGAKNINDFKGETL